jgi:hypothetical protein
VAVMLRIMVGATTTSNRTATDIGQSTNRAHRKRGRAGDGAALLYSLSLPLEKRGLTFPFLP